MFLSVPKYNELKEREPKTVDNFHSLHWTLFSFYRLGCPKQIQKVRCEIWGSHSGFVENSNLLGYHTVSFAQSSWRFEGSFCCHVQGTKYRNNCSCTVGIRKWGQQTRTSLGNTEPTEQSHTPEELNLQQRVCWWQFTSLHLPLPLLHTLLLWKRNY